MLLINPKAETNFNLHINADNFYRPIIKVKLFDNTNTLMEEFSYFPAEVVCKKALYTLRIELSGCVQDEVLIMNKSLKVKITSEFLDKDPEILYIKPPGLYSSVSFESGQKQYASSHEYYSMPIKLYSATATRKEERLDLTSSLYIFLRYPSKEKFDEVKSLNGFCRDFELLTELGQPICSFDDNLSVVRNDIDGWLALNTLLEPGIYYLRYSGKQARQIPIYVYDNWHTQFFMTIGYEPLYGSIRVYISENRYFDTYNWTNKYIDIFLDKLQNNDYYLSDNLIEIGAMQKFESPMLGLLCAYLYLLGPSDKQNQRFAVIVRNLQNLILKGNKEAPDLRALNILANEHLGTDFTIPNKAVRGTPMFRSGYDVIKRSAVKKTRLIKKNSLNDLITENQYCDSPFNTFKPIEIKIEEFPDIIESGSEISYLPLPRKSYRTLENSLSLENSEPPKRSGSNRIVKNLMGQRLFQTFINETGENNWIAASMSAELKKNEELSIKDLSKQLQISTVTLNRIIQDVIKRNGGSD